ncbi:MAG: hypothetical protein ACP5NC_04745 [Nitrososphaeria archaeon]
MYDNVTYAIDFLDDYIEKAREILTDHGLQFFSNLRQNGVSLFQQHLAELDT